MHLNSDNLFIEVTRKDGIPVEKGLTGDIVITDFNNFAMPFIRYVIEDRASLSSEKCHCGRSFPSLERLHGRSGEVLVAEDDELIHMSTIVLFMEKFNDISLYQLYQAKDKSIELRMQYTNHGATGKSPHNAQILSGIKRIVGKNIPIKIISFDTAPSAAFKKHRYIISDFNLINPT
jgi:phenylacetate-CoA ligase